MTTQKSIRTRVAPSPTGFPHIGTMYQALFNFAWAHKHDGKFLVRIEDTDQSRKVEGAEEAIFEALDWMDLTEDESVRQGGPSEPYRQSERLETYQKHAQQLVDQGDAYYCFCSRERLDEVRKQQQADKQVPMYDRHCLNLSDEEIKQKFDAGEAPVIRMKIPRGEVVVLHDPVRGDIEYQTDILDDQVILKSDGFPTYHLAVVVDDHEMEITDAIRGEEWIPSWPKHVLLYRFFGWDAPQYHHTPILRNPDKSKLSKRHGHTSVTWYQEAGYLPEALRNFLALMGWSHPDGEEIFTLDEFIQHFDLKHMKAVGPIFDLTKLEWLNGEYIRMMDEEDVAARVYAFSKQHFDDRYPEDLIRYTLPLIQTRIKTLREYDDYCRFFVETPTEYEVELGGNDEVFTQIVEAMERIADEDWHADIIGEHLQAVAQEIGLSFSKFFMLVRVALTGKKVTPPTNESMEILGKKECIERFNAVLS